MAKAILERDCVKISHFPFAEKINVYTYFFFLFRVTFISPRGPAPTLINVACNCCLSYLLRLAFQFCTMYIVTIVTSYIIQFLLNKP